MQLQFKKTMLPVGLITGEAVLEQICCKNGFPKTVSVLAQTGLTKTLIQRRNNVVYPAGCGHHPPSKHYTSKLCWFNVGPPSATLDQHWTNIVSMCRGCWASSYACFFLTSFLLYRSSGPFYKRPPSALGAGRLANMYKLGGSTDLICGQGELLPGQLSVAQCRVLRSIGMRGEVRSVDRAGIGMECTQRLTLSVDYALSGYFPLFLSRLNRSANLIKA